MNKILLIVLVCASLGIGLFWGISRRPVVHSENQEVSVPGMETPQNSKPTGLSTGSASAREKPAVVQTSIALTNLPEHIQPLVGEYAYELTWSIARKITPADKDILLQLYRQEPSLVKKRSLTIALGFVGDEEVVEVFKHTLSDQYAGRILSTGKGDNESDEELVMGLTVSVLGFLANKSDSAYELIKKGMDPVFWKDYCKFIPATGPDFYGILAGDSIISVGRSGRPDVSNVLEGLKPLPLVNSLDTSSMQMSFHGALVDAAFAKDMIIQHGLEYYKHLYLDLDLSLQQMHEWKKKGNGLEWKQWRQERGGSLRP